MFLMKSLTCSLDTPSIKIPPFNYLLINLLFGFCFAQRLEQSDHLRAGFLNRAQQLGRRGVDHRQQLRLQLRLARHLRQNFDSAPGP